MAEHAFCGTPHRPGSVALAPELAVPAAAMPPGAAGGCSVETVARRMAAQAQRRLQARRAAGPLPTIVADNALVRPCAELAEALQARAMLVTAGVSKAEAGIEEEDGRDAVAAIRSVLLARTENGVSGVEEAAAERADDDDAVIEFVRPEDGWRLLVADGDEQDEEFNDNDAVENGDARIGDGRIDRSGVDGAGELSVAMVRVRMQQAAALIAAHAGFAGW